MSKSALVVIPARLGSTRLPGKVLLPLGGLPVLEWCRRAALKAAVGDVVVATDSREVVSAVEARGGSAVMTPESCRSGTDRVDAAVRKLERSRGRRYPFIVNLQGDEPFFIEPSTIRGVAGLLWKGAQMATAVVPSHDPKDASNPNVVKVALAADGRCLYFSRAPIPFRSPHSDSNGESGLLRHIGIYGYTRAALRRFVSLPPSRLERVESLEQLRALEDGISISAHAAHERTLAIDTLGDLSRAARLLKNRFRRTSSHG